VIALAVAAVFASALPPLSCPAGTERKGGAPPDGYEEWCEARPPETGGAKRREGPARVYYDDGRIWVEERFAAGQRDGPFVEWHRNGKKAREGRFVQGAKDGRWTVWRDTGLVEEASSWRAGVPDGPFAAYWPTGKTRTEGRHCGGAQCGKWNTYDEGGRLLGSVDYGEQKGSP
jgi:antitoxin component YwqK of YwqJK toxin-antitoxin module